MKLKVCTANVLLAASVIALAGCANLNSQSRSLNSDKVQGRTVDASQRAIFSVAQSNGQTAICAEPSPDALIAYATSLGTSINAPGKAALDLAFSQSQAAASIGLRTQTIQLLRDGMYHALVASGDFDDRYISAAEKNLALAWKGTIRQGRLRFTCRPPNYRGL